MTEAEIQNLVQKQRSFFFTGATLDVEYRIRELKKLKECILKYENEINAAIKKDLGKSAFESYMCETGLVLSEITYMLKHIRRFAGEKTVLTPLSNFIPEAIGNPLPMGLL